MTTILFYFLIVLALAGSSYYGWKSAKSAKNRQETQEQKRLRSVLLFVNVQMCIRDRYRLAGNFSC